MTLESGHIAESLKTAQRHIMDARFTDAIEILQNLLTHTPDNIDALYMQAICLRYLNKPQDAFTALDRLLNVAPEYGRAYQERGHLHRSIHKTGDAIKDYQHACELNPALDASWQAQSDLLSQSGRKQEAKLALMQVHRLKATPKELIAVTHLIYENKILKAEQLCRQFLKKNRDHVEGMRLLAMIGSRLGVLEDAEFLLESALEFSPDNIQVRLDYIHILRKRQKHAAALEQARHLYNLDPESPVFQSHYAIESLQANDFEKAFEMFDKVLDRLPDDAPTLTSRGHALKTVGKQEEAIASYKKAFTVNPAQGDAYYALANLKTYRFSDTELSAMQEQEQRQGATYSNRIHLCFALGKAFEDRGDYKQSFTYYERGNDMKRLQSRYDADQMDEELQAQADVCTKELFENKETKGCQSPDPIFIVGLPRAGSTLLEQILASHSQVDGTLELPNILALSQRLRGHKKVSADNSYPKNLFTLTDQQLLSFGENYIDGTRIHRQNAPFFTDKMPNNFRHISLMRLILPNAKIIDARREPMACCFSGFKQLFAEGQEFTYGLEQIGRYYKGYVKLMRHWNEVLPGQILQVQYEDVVADLETQVRRILDFCDLPFEQACIDFHKTSRSVRTASSEQVRQPINTKGLEQWRPFEPFLSPLKEALGDTLTHYR